MRWYVWLNLLLYNILMLLVIPIKRRFIDKGKICQERENKELITGHKHTTKCKHVMYYPAWSGMDTEPGGTVEAAPRGERQDPNPSEIVSAS
jgi:hypothetical protein